MGEGQQGKDDDRPEDLRTILIDGDLLSSVTEFLAANPDLSPEEVGAVESLAVGESVRLGGGAAAEFTIRRLADMEDPFHA